MGSPVCNMASSLKLPNVDAQRILAVLEDVVSDTECLVLMGEGSEAIVPSLEALRESEAGFHDAMIEGGEVLAQQTEHLKQAGRNAIRAVKLDGVGRSEMQAVQTLRSEAMQRFLRKMRELHEQTFLHLEMSVEEETQKHEQKDEPEHNLKMNTMSIMTTSHELEQERTNRQKHVATRDEQIKKLTKEILDIKTSTENDKKRIEETTKQQETNLETAFNEQEKIMQKELEKLHKQFDERCLANAEAEKELRRLKKVREEKVGSVLLEYDEFMDEMEQNINEKTDKYNQETEDLARYNKDFADVMAWREERNRREEAERAEEERKRREEKLEYDSATCIQKAYRDYCDRRAAAKKGKKKKKKK